MMCKPALPTIANLPREHWWRVMRKLVGVVRMVHAHERDERIARRREEISVNAKIPAVIEDYLAYKLRNDIAAKHDLLPSVVSRMIRENTTEAQRLNVRRFHIARRERDHQRRQRADQGVIPRLKPVVVAGVLYPSISAAARAFGLRPGTAQRRQMEGIPLDASKRKHQRAREKEKT